MPSPAALDIRRFFGQLKPELERLCLERTTLTVDEWDELFARRRISLIKNREKRTASLKRHFTRKQVRDWQKFYGAEEDDFLCFEDINTTGATAKDGKNVTHHIYWMLNPDKWKLNP